MQEWPNVGAPDPAADLKRAAMAAGGSVEMSAAELGERFGVQRLTKAARARMAQELRAAGLSADPPVETAQRWQRVTLALPVRRVAGESPREGGRPRRRWPWLAGGAVALLLLIVAVAGGNGEDRSSGRSPEATPAASPPGAAAASANPTPDPEAAARRRAKALAGRGRYLAAVAVLERRDADGPLLRRLRRQGAHALLRRARAELAASHEQAATTNARRAHRLGAGDGATLVVQTAAAQAAAERAAARERRRLAAIARDQQTCSAAEKADVDAGAATPAGCAAYAAQVAPDEPAPASACDPNYAGACLDPDASDYDCEGGSGDGPKYVQGPIRVVGTDRFDLERDGDGIACDT